MRILEKLEELSVLQQIRVGFPHTHNPYLNPEGILSFCIHVYTYGLSKCSAFNSIQVGRKTGRGIGTKIEKPCCSLFEPNTEGESED